MHICPVQACWTIVRHCQQAFSHAGESFSDENTNPNLRSWSVGSGPPTHPWGSPLQPHALSQLQSGNAVRAVYDFCNNILKPLHVLLSAKHGTVLV